MTNAKREEIITAMNNLLEQLVENDKPKAESVTTAPEQVEMLTIKECTEAVKCLNEYTVRQLIARNEIPHIRCGQGKLGKILVPKAALLRYFAGEK